MSEYKRFTEKVDSGFVSELDCRIAYNKLSGLEDKIESGRLVELPCKVGDTVYCVPSETQYKINCVNRNFDRNRIMEIEIEYVEFNEHGWFLANQYKHDIFTMEFFGITWFLTRESAEVRLKELQEGKK